MVIELILVGIFIGTMSGFFGIGGGMILVPILLALGFEIKMLLVFPSSKWSSLPSMVLTSIIKKVHSL